MNNEQFRRELLQSWAIQDHRRHRQTQGECKLILPFLLLANVILWTAYLLGY